MDQQEIRAILEQVAQGKRTVDEAVLALKMEPFTELGFAKVDNHRGLRQGAAEVIYGAGKTPQQIRDIAASMRQTGEKTILITRMSEEAAQVVGASLPLDYHPIGRVGIVGDMPAPTGKGTIVVATGGTSDMPVAEEAALTAQVLGNQVTRLYDVGGGGLAPHPVPSGGHYERPGHHRHRGHGGGLGQRHRGPFRLPGDRRAHQRGLWGGLWRPGGSAVHAELLRQRRQRGEHRQTALAPGIWPV